MLVHQYIYTITMACKTMTLLAQWLGQHGCLQKVVSLNLNPRNFLFDAHKDLFLYIQCMYIVCTLYILVCTWYRHVHHFECLWSDSVHGSPWFILVHPCLYTVSTHLNTVCTRQYQLQTMLWYRNWPFGTDSVQTRIYTLKTALAGGKLSCGISSK